ncbi:MAG: Uma2 family endonuclease [Okeania sp. SIO3C4]|nr:Uma2 family endonuclease [Okeania sp. SIO3C4]
MSVELKRRQFTVKEYDLMVEAGILKNDDKVELIAGEIIQMAPMGLCHASCLRRLNRIINKLLYSKVIIDTQIPIQLNDESEPEPDLILLQLRDDFYEKKHPQPEDIFLLVEVADSTIKYDREIKIPLYAENGISEAWLIDINQQYYSDLNNIWNHRKYLWFILLRMNKILMRRMRNIQIFYWLVLVIYCKI